MTNIRRYFRQGDVIFVTNVSHNRMPILVDNFDLLWKAIASTKQKTRFDILAWAILPDHFHMVIDAKENDLSTLIKRIKLSFSAYYRKRKGLIEGRIWQNRYWDHIIRNQKDLNRHIDYIHINPVMHGFVPNAIEWEYSSVHRYFEDGYYSKDWGSNEELVIEGEFGE